MLQNKKIRQKALESLDGNWGDSSVMTFVYLTIASILSVGGSVLCINAGLTYTIGGQPADPSGFAMGLLLLPMNFAMMVAFLGLVRGAAVRTGNLFKYYTTGKVWALGFLTALYLILWMLLFLIPGIIKYYSYSMTPYILKDNPEISAEQAICDSMKMMKGYKMKLFLLDLSFIGWAILALLTLGLGVILLEPYMLTARAVFYEELKAELGMAGSKSDEII